MNLFDGMFSEGNLPTSQTAQALRQKIALAMMMKKSVAPKNLGEGLAAIGEALGERGLAARTEREAAESAKRDAEAAGKDYDVPVPATPATPATPAVGPQAVLGPGTGDVVALANGTEPADPAAPATPAAPAAPAVASANAGGFRPPPGYLRDRLAALVTDPERRGYLGHLAGREARSANEVSSTGAAGPFQFTRGTGAQYGIPGDARFDVDKSIIAANKLTDDNAAVLARGLGRPPSPGELALAHQQGAGTAVKMLLGTGNASARNLAVNNAGGGPQQAAQKIMSYYGMPGSGGGGGAPAPGSRDSIAAALTAETPPTPADTAQEARVSDVLGMSRAPPSFGATASAGRTGDVMSDMPPVTGALGGPMGQSIGDSAQSRQATFGAQPQPAPTPAPGGTQVAAGPQPSVFPPVATDAPQAILPGGGFQQFQPPVQPQSVPQPDPSVPPPPQAAPLVPPPPQAAPTPPPPQQTIPQAPPDPRAAIRQAPQPQQIPPPQPGEYVPGDNPRPQPPAKPAGPGPVERELTRRVLLTDTAGPLQRAAANARIAAEQKAINDKYANEVLDYNARLKVFEKKDEQDRLYGQNLGEQRSKIRKSNVDADKTVAEMPSILSKAQIDTANAKFYERTGQDREPFLKKFDAMKDAVSKAAPILRDTQIAREALDGGLVSSGTGADAQNALAKIAAKIGSTDARKVADANAMYNSAIQRTVTFGVQMLNGTKDPRVTDTDLKMAQSMLGSPSEQEAAKRKVLDIMQEDMHGKVREYEDMREHYLYKDPQHRMYKVDVPAIASPALEQTLIRHQERPDVIQEFNRQHGPGAAELVLARHRRKMERPDE